MFNILLKTLPASSELLCFFNVDIAISKFACRALSPPDNRTFCLLTAHDLSSVLDFPLITCVEASCSFPYNVKISSTDDNSRLSFMIVLQWCLKKFNDTSEMYAPF